MKVFLLFGVHVFIVTEQQKPNYSKHLYVTSEFIYCMLLVQ